MQRFLRQSPYILKINLSNHRNFSKLVGEDVVRPTIGLDEDARTFYDLAKSFADNEMKPYCFFCFLFLLFSVSTVFCF